MSGRRFLAAKAKYGFNGQMKDNEVYGEGNSTTAEFWQYDPRTAHRFNLDPKSHAWWSPYSVFYDMPIFYADPDGDCPVVVAVVALVMLADVLVAPTNDHIGDAAAIAAARRDHDFGLLGIAAGPLAGKIVSKVATPIISKIAPKITKITQKVISKKATEKLVQGSEQAATKLETKIVETNPVPDRLARVVPNTGSEITTLGKPGAEDVFVTAAKDIEGLGANEIADKLTIPQSKSGFKVFEFETPVEGIASPVFRKDVGFIGKGKTLGGAREFSLPNLKIKDLKNVTDKIVK